jgi:moderate conductance mechanosensitive channel
MTESYSKWTEMVGIHGLRLVTIVVIAIVLNRLLRAFTTRLVDLAKSQTRLAQMREQQTRTMAGLLFSAGTIIIIAGATLAALPEFGFNITPIAALAGLASLAFGFGAQYLVRDLINGFLIVFEDQYVVGDRVRIGEETGRVEYISLRRTVLRNDRGAVVSIPNGSVGQVANLSRDWSQTWVDVLVPSDEAVGRALEVLERIAAELRSDPEWSAALLDGPRVLGVESLSLTGTTLRISIRSAPMRQDDVARELRRRVKGSFEKEQIPLSVVQRVELAGQEDRKQ